MEQKSRSKNNLSSKPHREGFDLKVYTMENLEDYILTSGGMDYPYTTPVPPDGELPPSMIK